MFSGYYHMTRAIFPPELWIEHKCKFGFLFLHDPLGVSNNSDQGETCIHTQMCSPKLSPLFFIPVSARVTLTHWCTESVGLRSQLHGLILYGKYSINILHRFWSWTFVGSAIIKLLDWDVVSVAGSELIDLFKTSIWDYKGFKMWCWSCWN